MRHLDKEDKSKAKNGETLDFKVIEFSKDSKKIIVSHTRTFQDGKDDVHAEGDDKKGRATSKSVKQINESLEKTTLGDLDIFQKLKEEN
jgi:small subunit ribosomal protein S1